MNIAHILRGKALAATVAGLVALGGGMLILLAHSAPAPADVNLNNLDCRGHVQKGAPEADDPSATQVQYVFACNGPITGYQIQPNLEVQSLETEVFGIDPATKQVLPNDSFSCNGDIPGYGVNCVGNAGFLDNAKQSYDPSQKSYVMIPGRFEIDADICAEPRVDPLLTVVTATRNAKGDIVQQISGPFDLGRPIRSKCKPTPSSGKTRIPSTGPDTDASNSEIG